MFAMGCSSGAYNPPGTWWSVKQNLGPLALILPFLEQTAVYNAINFTDVFSLGQNQGAYWRSTWNQTVWLTQVNGFLCPSDIDRLKIKAVPLAPVGQKPQVGQHVFAIGHPGGGETVLTSTTTPGASP